MKELFNRGFIAETTVQSSYFINPDFMFNSDRLLFVNSYILCDSKGN